jgi:hypothetical protein
MTASKQKRRKIMFTISLYVKKIAMIALVLAIGLATIPAAGASAAGLSDQTTPPASQPDNSRLERAWARAQAVYAREGARLSRADEFIGRAQALIDKAAQKGWDTSAVQAALDALSAVIPAVQAAHDKGAAIIANHDGFDGSGKVTDRVAALDTVKALIQVLKDTRTAMDGTGKALREAVRAFWQAHHTDQGNSTLTP